MSGSSDLSFPSLVPSKKDILLKTSVTTCSNADIAKRAGTSIKPKGKIKVARAGFYKSVFKLHSDSKKQRGFQASKLSVIKRSCSDTTLLTNDKNLRKSRHAMSRSRSSMGQIHTTAMSKIQRVKVQNQNWKPEPPFKSSWGMNLDRKEQIHLLFASRKSVRLSLPSDSSSMTQIG